MKNSKNKIKNENNSNEDDYVFIINQSMKKMKLIIKFMSNY